MSDPVFREGDRLLLPVTVVKPWLYGERKNLILIDLPEGGSVVVPATLLVRESEVLARALEEAARVADKHAEESCARAFQTARAWKSRSIADDIRALIEKPEGERS